MSNLLNNNSGLVYLDESEISSISRKNEGSSNFLKVNVLGRQFFSIENVLSEILYTKYLTDRSDNRIVKFNRSLVSLLPSYYKKLDFISQPYVISSPYVLCTFHLSRTSSSNTGYIFSFSDQDLVQLNLSRFSKNNITLKLRDGKLLIEENNLSINTVYSMTSSLSGLFFVLIYPDNTTLNVNLYNYSYENILDLETLQLTMNVHAYDTFSVFTLNRVDDVAVGIMDVNPTDSVLRKFERKNKINDIDRQFYLVRIFLVTLLSNVTLMALAFERMNTVSGGNDAVAEYVGAGYGSIFNNQNNKIIAMQKLINEYNSTNVKYLKVKEGVIMLPSRFYDSVMHIPFLDSNFHTSKNVQGINFITSLITSGGNIGFKRSLSNITNLCVMNNIDDSIKKKINVFIALDASIRVVSADVNVVKRVKTDVSLNNEYNFTTQTIYVSGSLNIDLNVEVKMGAIVMSVYVTGSWFLPPTDFVSTTVPKISTMTVGGLQYVRDNNYKVIPMIEHLTASDLTSQYAIVFRTKMIPVKGIDTIIKITDDMVVQLKHPVTKESKIAAVRTTTYQSFSPYFDQPSITESYPNLNLDVSDIPGINVNMTKNSKDNYLNLTGFYDFDFLLKYDGSISYETTSFGFGGSIPSLPGETGNITEENLMIDNLEELSTYNLTSLTNIEITLTEVRKMIDRNTQMIDNILKNANDQSSVGGILQTAGMVVQFVYPPVGMSLMAGGALIDLINHLSQDTNPKDIVIVAVNAIVLTCHAFRVVNNSLLGLFSFNNSLNMDKMNLKDVNNYKEVKRVLEWDVIGGWRNKNRILNEIMMEKALAYDNMKINVMGSVEVMSHRYSPVDNGTILNAFDFIQDKMPTYYNGLRKVNLAPEHAKIITEYLDVTDNGLVRTVDVMGVADFSNVNALEGDNAMKDTGIKRNLQVGSIKVASRLTKDGEMHILDFAELGYTEDDVKNFSSGIPELSHLFDAEVSIKYLWRALSEFILSHEYTSSLNDTTVKLKSIPIPNRVIIDFLHTYFKEEGNKIQYNLITQNCQSIANGIFEILTNGTKPKWMSDKKYLELCTKLI